MTLALSVMATVSFASVMTAVTVTKKEFDKFLARDKHCFHCAVSPMGCLRALRRLLRPLKSMAGNLGLDKMH
mgnify:CR=1 FL=1